MKLSGRLIYTSGGNDINVIELSNLKHHAFRLPSVDSINLLTNFSDSAFIFEDCNGLRSPNCTINLFDLATNTYKTLHSGQFPTYIHKNNSIIFYKTNKKTGRLELHITVNGSSKSSSNLFKAPVGIKLPNGLNYSIINKPILVSSDEFVFVGENRNLWLYKLSKSKIINTNIKRCLPMVWISRNKQLICRDWNSQELYQTTLTSGDRKMLPELKGAYGLVYDPRDDVIIYGETKLKKLISESYDIYAYSFKTKKQIKIYANSHLLSGVWLP